MRKQDAEKWVEALRSGKYQQGSGYLREGNQYCCLGVLNELFPELDLAGGSLASLKNSHRIGLWDSFGNFTAVAESPAGELGYSNLAALNDSGFTFDEIADVIQIEYIEGL